MLTSVGIIQYGFHRGTLLVDGREAGPGSARLPSPSLAGPVRLALVRSQSQGAAGTKRRCTIRVLLRLEGLSSNPRRPRQARPRNKRMSGRSPVSGSVAVTEEFLALSPGRSQRRPEAPVHATGSRVPGRGRQVLPGQQAVQKALGARIRQLRMEKGLSQKKLASLSGLSSSSVVQLELGRSNATVSTLVALKRYLGVTVSELFRDIG
jgi:DNA-binding XRE family transcriptional regulator